MFFHSSNPSTDALVAGFAELESELGVPIRVLSSAAQINYTAPEWRTNQVEGSGFTVADGRERGITVVPWACVGPARLRYCEYGFPGELYTNGQLRQGSMYDVYEPSSEPEDVEFHSFAESTDENLHAHHFAAQIGERLVTYMYPAFSVAELSEVDYESVFFALIKRAADPEFVARMAERREAAERERFTDWCQNSRNRALTNVRAEIEHHEQNLGFHQQSLGTVYSQLRDLKAQADAMEAAIGVTADEWMDTWRKLGEHPRVTALGFNTSHCIVLTTNMITMSHPNHGSRTLGRFRITIGVNGESGISFENLDYPRNGRHHPHIPASGVACWGDAAATIAKYHGELQLIGLVEMLFMFLESFNENDDWGTFAALWYDVPDALEGSTDDAISDAIDNAINTIAADHGYDENIAAEQAAALA